MALILQAGILTLVIFVFAVKSQSMCGEYGELTCYTGCCPTGDPFLPEKCCDENGTPVPPDPPVMPTDPANTIAPDMSTTQSSSTGSKVLKVGEIIGIVCGCIAGVGSAIGTIVKFGKTIRDFLN